MSFKPDAEHHQMVNTRDVSMGTEGIPGARISLMFSFVRYWSER